MGKSTEPQKASIRNRKDAYYATAETLTSEGNCGAPGVMYALRLLHRDREG